MAARRSAADRFLKGLCRLVLRVFFRRVEVVGLEDLPRDRPLILVANHVNGLVDPLLLFGPLPLLPRFLAKSTLWDIPILKNLLDLARVIPVYRHQDAGVDTSKNVETFARCHDLLARGGTIGLFPEGTSHNEPAILPLKTGAARIALEAETKHGPLGVHIVPVGLIYDQKERFRSRVLVEVGEPLDPSEELETFETGSREAVQHLTDRIDRGLATVTLNYDSWDEARRIGRAADLYERPRLDVPRRRRLQEEYGLRRAFLEAYAELRTTHPEEVHELAEAVGRYDRLLEAFGLRDEQVAADYAPTPVFRFLTRSVFLLGVGFPVAVLGAVLNVLPYQLLKLLAYRFREFPDQQATYKIFPGLLLYPFAWLLEAVAAGWAAERWLDWTSWWVALGVLAAGPITGWVALRFLETGWRLREEARAFLVLRTRRQTARELRKRRAEVYRRIEELADTLG